MMEQRCVPVVHPHPTGAASTPLSNIGQPRGKPARGLNKPCAREQTMHCRLDGVGDTCTILYVLHCIHARVVLYTLSTKVMKACAVTIVRYQDTVRTMAARG